jgi:hypothetical protein
MTGLRDIQTWMQDALRFPAGADAGRFLAATPNLTASAGLAIYQRSYFQRIASCMREQFPALCHALGTPLFDDFVAEYIREMPPESHTLYDLGRRFADYLDASRPDQDAPEVWIDFMIDLARYERQLFVLFDAPGQEGQPFATADTPDSALRLQPCFALGAYRFPVAEYYHAVRAKSAPALPPAKPSHVAMVRVAFLTRTVPLTEPHYLFLTTLRSGHDADQAIETVAQHVGIPPDDVRRSWHSPGGMRQRWIDAGFFIRHDG